MSTQQAMQWADAPAGTEQPWVITFKDGTKQCDVMTKGEIDAIRKRSRASGSGPWVTDYNEMAKKTVFRRLSKWLPLSAEIREVVEADDEHAMKDVTPTGPALMDVLRGTPVAENPELLEVMPETEAETTEGGK